MTFIEKLRNSIETATGLPFLYHAAGDLEVLLSQQPTLPVVYAFLIESGAVADVNGLFHERATLAVMFANTTEFDFNSAENEAIIDGMKRQAFGWLSHLRRYDYGTLDLVGVNSTQRLYDTTAAILTGFAVNVTLQEVEAHGCE